MTNEQVSIYLSLKDEVSAKWGMITSKMAASSREFVDTVKQHWLGISAGAVAAFAIINKAWDFAEGFLKQEQARETFRSMVESMGKDADRVFNEINDKAAGLIDDGDILAASNRALSLGVKVEALGDLMAIARMKARDLGITAKEGFELITEAVGKSSQRKLKELGITIDLKKEHDFLTATLIAGKEALDRNNLSMLTTFERIQKIRASMEGMKDFAGQWAMRIAGVLFAGFNLVAVGVGRVIEGILYPLAKMEAAMRAMGLTTSWTFTHLLEDTQEGIRHFSDETRAAWDAATASSRELAGALGGAGAVATNTGDAVTELGDKFNKIHELAISQTRYISEMEQKMYDEQIWFHEMLTATETKRSFMVMQHSDETLRKVTTNLRTTAKVALDTGKMLADSTMTFMQENASIVQGIYGGLTSSIGQMWEDVFTGQEAVAKKMFKNILLSVIDLAQGLLMAALVVAQAKGILTFFATIASDLALLATATVGLQLLRAFVSSSFHSGGVVPKDGGTYFDAPASREFPILVRGGETVRTESQEAALQSGSGTTVVVNINAPVDRVEWVKDAVEEGLRAVGLKSADRYFQNNRGTIALGTA